MPLTDEDLAVVKACYEEKHWYGTEICRQFKSKGWSVRTVNEAIKRLQETGTIYRKKGSGRPIVSATSENVAIVDDLIQSQEEQPGTHRSQRQIASQIDVSLGAVNDIVQKSGLKSLKRHTAPQTKEDAKRRRVERSESLLTRFPTWKVKMLTFQDEKDFTLQVPTNSQNNRVYTRGKKADISSDRLYHNQNRFSMKLMVSACVSWNGATKPFFVDPSKIKVSSKVYLRHLKRELLPACDDLAKGEKYYFMQDGATSHTAGITQEYLWSKFGRRFIRKDQWPPHSPDCNPLDFYFWDAIKRKVCEGRREPFHDLDVLKKRIRKVWKKAFTVKELRKAILQFRPRLKAVVSENGGPIKSFFG